MATDKDTIYIDIDDEITGVIDKLNRSDGKVVAFVLPKRAAVFQSIVNMKLLKRAADESTKHLVLITGEAGLLPLAGAAGVHVAKTLTSKPEIPTAPPPISDAEEMVDENDETMADAEEITADNAGDQAVGDLAGLPPAADEVETVELDNETPEEADLAAAATGVAAVAKAPKTKKDSKLKVPNFEGFRTKLFIGIAAFIVLVVLFILASIILPKATIAIKTDATTVPVTLDLNLSTTATSLKTSNKTLPAKLAQQQKTYSQQVATTGQKNNGNKATGSATLTDCTDNDVTIPAGTGFSSSGNTYISQQTVTVPASSFRHGSCQSDEHATVTLTAQNAGTAYNSASGTSFTVSGNSSISAKANGAISGGTDNNVQVVTQTDINTAKNKISTNDDSVKQALQSQLKGENYYAITATYNAGTPTTTNSTNVGDAANNVTVTETITYSLFGVKNDDLKSLLDTAIKSQIDTNKQSILDDGLGKANFNVSNSSATAAQVTMATSATAGPELNVDSIKQQSAGKKSADVKSQLTSNPDVTDVQVKLSPFWVSSVPKKISKIKVTIAKPATNASSPSNSNANNP